MFHYSHNLRLAYDTTVQRSVVITIHNRLHVITVTNTISHRFEKTHCIQSSNNIFWK